jgi:predicted nucleotidyltransferase
MKIEATATVATEDRALQAEFASYLPHIRYRWLAQQEAWEQCRQEARQAAGEVATILRTHFSADKVIAFGSLVHRGRFSDRSDIDLAVSNILPSTFFKAWASAAASCPFELDLVDLADCSPALRRLIEEERVP